MGCVRMIRTYLVEEIRTEIITILLLSSFSNDYRFERHSKCGVYVCKYADVCIRHASARRTWEGNVGMKMLVFKIVEGKQTTALVRKGSKLQPIAPTANFTSHCSIIVPKETDDLEKQFDQSQIFLYEFEGRETIKRPHHCLPYAVVSLIQDGSQWPTNFDNLDNEPNILETDTLRVIAHADDPLLQNKLNENVELAETATLALEHVYEEDPPIQTPQPLQSSSLSIADGEYEQQTSSQESGNSQMISAVTMTSSDNTSIPTVNGRDVPSSASPNGHSSTLSNDTQTDTTDSSLNLAVSLPLPPPSSNATTNPTTKTATATSEATVIPLTAPTATVQAVYRQQTGLLGALPGAAALRSVPGAVYATTNGLSNGLPGQIVYSGVPADAFRGFPTTATASATGAPYVLAAHAGQAIQQPALYAAQLQAIAQQQQAVQLAAVAAAQQQQQQQQQSFMNGLPAGCMVVRTANGGYALMAQSPTASAAAVAALQTQAPLTQQQYISINAAGQPTAMGATGAARVPVALVGGQPQSVFYQYAGQPTMQTALSQYIQIPTNYGQQQQQNQLPTTPTMQCVNSATSQAYTNQSPIQYIGAPQAANNNVPNSSSATVVSPSPTLQSQATPTITSPQKQSAASATAAALQQQQQYQHQYPSASSQQQQQQQQAINGAYGAGVYYTTLAQVQAQQQQAALLAQQHQQLNLISQVPYATQQGISQQMYYATPGGQAIYQAGSQSYVIAQPGITTTGAPAIYSAGPALHNGATQQQSDSSQQQQPAQLVQRPSVLSQVRHHPYRN
ncbi:unnamed protein product [Adineta ricciae]|uniref:TASOR pseudo-PARP domain-containing protein n=1 Tax=Adineta ricciae TaxID=249248 RepID=A0A815DN02_ADIRI|nr:unnamed protein product [Adineta ricciae]